jgi:hypothetical protein
MDNLKRPHLSTHYFRLLWTQARFDYERQRYFQHDEKVRIADITLNERLQGLNFLDVVVSDKKGRGLNDTCCYARCC